MAFKIIWTQTACDDLKQIVQYIALDNPSAGANLARRILDRIEQAGNLPLSNRVVPEKGDDSIRELILNPYRIIYHIDLKLNAIFILRIWHASRGIPDITS